MTRFELERLCGWIHLPAEIDKVVGSLMAPTFADAARHLKGTGSTKDTYFWGWEQTLLGKLLAAFNQKIGDCVGQGWARATQDLVGLQISGGRMEAIPKEVVERFKQSTETGEHGVIATEPIYGGSRCEVGGQWGSDSDGSVGAWAAKWVGDYGITWRMKYPNVDLSHYDPRRAKEYGRRGCPDDLELESKKHLVKMITQVKNYDEVRDMVCNGYPVPVASNQGFSMKRIKGGWCRAEGTWMHQMTFRGHFIIKGNKPAIVCQNSWGDYLGSDNEVITLETGQELILPEGSFLVEPEVVTKMARQGDTFAISDVQGFPFNPDPTPWIFR